MTAHDMPHTRLPHVDDDPQWMWCACVCVSKTASTSGKTTTELADANRSVQIGDV